MSAGRLFLLLAALLIIGAPTGVSGASAHSNTIRLTTDPRFDGQPVYSPSGRKIAFIRGGSTGGELWVMNSDGSEQVKLSDGDVSSGGGDFPQWSPDDKRIVFWKRSPEWGIYDVHLRTGVVRRLVPGDLQPSQLALSPDGRRIAFTGGDYFQIFVADSDGEHVTSLTPQLPYGTQPAWSPNGRKIAFVSFRDDSGRAVIFVMNADGSNVQDVTAAYPDLQGQFPVWSQNGEKIAFTGIFPSGDTEEIDIFVMNADGSGLVDVSNIPLGTEDTKVWSPDGKMLAFDSLGGSAESEGVYTVGADGGQLQLLARASSSPSWAPNGKRIAFHGSLDGQDNSDIYAAVVKRQR